MLSDSAAKAVCTRHSRTAAEPTSARPRKGTKSRTGFVVPRPAVDATHASPTQANNDLGTAVGWWTPGHDIHADDEASERRGALRTALRNHRRGDATPVDVSEAEGSSSDGEESDGGQAARDVAGLRARGGELARAERAQDATRTLAAIKALGECRVSLATLKGATATTKLLGRMGRKAPNLDVRRAAAALVERWKRVARRDGVAD